MARPGRCQRGFTLVEIAAVIVLLAVLAVIAIPYYVSLRDEAMLATVRGVAGSFRGGVELFHYRWRILGGNGAIQNVPGVGNGTLDSNVYGYPAGVDGGATVGNDTDCVDTWRQVLSLAPSIDRADPTKERGNTIHHIEPKLGLDIEYTGGQDASIPDATIALDATNGGQRAQICQYIFLGYQSVEPGAPKVTIFYNSRTGTVQVDPDRQFN